MVTIKVNGEDKEIKEQKLKQLVTAMAKQSIPSGMKKGLEETAIQGIQDYVLKGLGLKEDGPDKLVLAMVTDPGKIKEFESLRKGEAGPSATSIISSAEKFRDVGRTQSGGVSADQVLRDITNLSQGQKR